MAGMGKLEVEIKPGVVLVTSGDTLVVAHHGPLTEAEAARAEERIGARLPGVKVLVIEADGLAVYRK